MEASNMEVDDLADGGYAAAQAVARGSLRQGCHVIADCVNPIVSHVAPGVRLRVM